MHGVLGVGLPRCKVECCPYHEDLPDETMASLTTSIKHFTSINRAPGPTWTETSKRKIHPFSRFDREPFRELAPQSVRAR